MTHIRSKRGTLVMQLGTAIPDDLTKDLAVMLGGIARVAEAARSGDPFARDAIRSFNERMSRDGFA